MAVTVNVPAPDMVKPPEPDTMPLIEPVVASATVRVLAPRAIAAKLMPDPVRVLLFVNVVAPVNV